ncbi:hypothetical protein RM844_25260 [Streptomyces sp. DSM 44915]|uniref:Uncharacterized protein n=1 Tax=Streptomyces chisholmiae TaxID=3075540 RepID=A0ABU2JXC2_9ACTN|nr:hypothetical protein [Streptomyces sp. DSM 44915]MDT0269597.1 hypothetical protein [Streptomyces sp. DSM 44915]
MVRRHYRVAAGSGRVLGAFDAHAAHPYDRRPLGDGTWLTTDASGHPVRWFEPAGPERAVSPGGTGPG